MSYSDVTSEYRKPTFNNAVTTGLRTFREFTPCFTKSSQQFPPFKQYINCRLYVETNLYPRMFWVWLQPLKASALYPF